MRQYDAFKKRHPDCLLLFRMGDFYELFDEDAVTAHKALGITLTQRTEGIPMAGVPYHAVETYLRRLISQGFRVAVCDQIQDPKEAKGVVERAVTRVLTPGTLVDESLLDESAPNNLAAAAFLDAGDGPDARVALAIVELSTGAFTVLETTSGGLIDELARRKASELLFAEAPAGLPASERTGGAPPPRIDRVLRALSIPGSPQPAWHFRAEEAREALLKHFGVASLSGFGLRDDDPTIPAAGAIIRYLRATQSMDDPVLAGRGVAEGHRSGTAAALVPRWKSLAHIQPPRRENPDGFLTIDAVSLRALEVERTIRNASGVIAPDHRAPLGDGSLLGLFLTGQGACRTPMGKRLLRDWLCRPSAQREVIEQRHACVSVLVEDGRTAAALEGSFRGVQDVPRLSARVSLGRASPRDLVALARALARLAPIADAISGAPAFARYGALLEAVRPALAELAADISRACVDEPPAHLRDGGLIRPGIDAELDEARALQESSGKWLAEYQARLIALHDLPSLRVGYNKIFGYFIELPAAQARRAPAEFTRRQTLRNAERFITPELKEYEDKVLSAADRALAREQDLFARLCSRASAQARAIAQFAQTIAELDVFLCFAARARAKAWNRPAMVAEPVLAVTQGRHPVLEEVLGANFVPNDVTLGLGPPSQDPRPKTQDTSLALITGPNMAGKSTFIRQVALIVLLAHAGSFVPADAATIGITDRIFTRIGADDALHAGQSTFMVEMVETASILHHATPRSLIVLDEIGRGTSTLDGLALAWAIAERLAGATSGTAGRIGQEAPTPRTLFATHYHELTDIADRLPGRVVNLHVAVREWGDEIIFVHRIQPGRSSRSYGIHVARLAGLPPEVVRRADEVLETLSVSHGAGAAATPREPAARERTQLRLFESPDHPAIAELKRLDLDHLTPVQAFDALRALRDRIERNGPGARP